MKIKFGVLRCAGTRPEKTILGNDAVDSCFAMLYMSG